MLSIALMRGGDSQISHDADVVIGCVVCNHDPVMTNRLHEVRSSMSAQMVLEQIFYDVIGMDDCCTEFQAHSSHENLPSERFLHSIPLFAQALLRRSAFFL